MSFLLVLDLQMSCCTTSSVSSLDWPCATIRPVSRIAKRWVMSRTKSRRCSTSRIEQFALGENALDDVLDLFDHRRLQSLGRLVEEQQLRLLHERAGDRQLLLLAAGQDAALAAGESSLSAGK